MVGEGKGGEERGVAQAIIPFIIALGQHFEVAY